MMSFLTRYVLPVIALATLAFAVSQVVKAQTKPPTAAPIEPGKSPFARQLAGSGIVEPETENIAIGSHVAGVVDKVFVAVGQTVKPGDRLFQIDDRTLRAERTVKQALLASAEASLAKLDQSPRKDERPSQVAKVLEAKVGLDDQQQQYARLLKVGGAAVSEDELTRRQMAVELAKAQQARAQGDFDLWEAGAWEPDRLIARAAVAQAKASVTQTEIELTRLTVMAPHTRWAKGKDGQGGEVPDDAGVEFKVLQVNVRAGESVGTGAGAAVIVLGCVGRLHVRADLDENDIARFRPDMPGVAKLRGNPDVALPLSFVRVDPYVIPKKSLTGANTERVDTRVLQVIYRIDGDATALYVGQQVDVFLNAK